MVVSNEPGFYHENEYGIRIENLIYVKNQKDFYNFEVLTKFPYESNLIDLSLLEKEEIEMINCYHKQVKFLINT
jgi:Xaa-Pro aminopeptidase